MQPNSRPRRVFAGALPALTLLLVSPALSGPAEADAKADESAGTIEDLLKGGWQVAGYTGTFDNRGALILFRNPNEMYLVQCLAGYDVTRTPRVYENCYRLK